MMNKKIQAKIKISSRLLSSIILMAIAFVLLVSASFAWLTMSSTPEIAGVKVTIAGDNTILIADNKTTTLEDGVVINYPGYFMKNSSLTTPLEATLSPVSTADGVNWFIPSVNVDENDVAEEMVVTDLSSLTLDTEFEYANSSDGGYIYLDFWVVSPLDNCYIRLSSGDLDKSKDDAELGSYVVQLPEIKKSYTNSTGYILDDSYQTLASSVRVGFLVNDEYVTTDEEMEAYASSLTYNDDYTRLKGIYGGDEDDYSFIIYEPNGLSHPNEGFSVQLTEEGPTSFLCQPGEYWITRPIGINDKGERVLVDILDRLVVQTECGWIKDETGSLMIDQMFQTYLKRDDLDDANLLEDFYQLKLENNYLQYVDAGHFFDSTSELYFAGNHELVNEEELTIVQQNNVVTEAKIVKLEKNVPQRIRMFVWIEGQDVDCNDSASGQTIAVRLELAGSSGA